MIICIDPREVRSSWAPWGIPTSESTSSRGGGPDLIASGSVKSCYGVMVVTASACVYHHPWTDRLPQAQKPPQDGSGVCGAVAHSSWGSGSPPSSHGLLCRGWGSHRLLLCNLQHGGIQQVIPLNKRLETPAEVLRLCHRVFQGEPQHSSVHTAGGPRPVPPSDLMPHHSDVPGALECGRWGRQEILASQVWPG